MYRIQQTHAARFTFNVFYDTVSEEIKIDIVHLSESSMIPISY